MSSTNLSPSEVLYISSDTPLFFHAHTTLRDKSFLLTTPRLSIKWSSDTTTRAVVIRDVSRKMLLKFCAKLKPFLADSTSSGPVHLNSDGISLWALRELLEWMKKACSQKCEYYPQPGTSLSKNTQLYQGIITLGVPYLSSDFYKSIQTMITNDDLTADDVQTLWKYVNHNDKVIDHLISTISYGKFTGKIVNAEKVEEYLVSQPALKARIDIALRGLKMKGQRQMLRDKTNTQRSLQLRIKSEATGLVSTTMMEPPSPKRPSYAQIASEKKEANEAKKAKEVKEIREPQAVTKPKASDIDEDMPFHFPPPAKPCDLALEDKETSVEEQWIFGWDQDGNRVMRRVI